MRCYLGGVGREAILERDDEALTHCVRAELAATVGLQATPRYVEVNRWHRAMRPDYTIGHLDRLAQLEAALSRFGGLAVQGAGLPEVGISTGIRQWHADGVADTSLFANNDGMTSSMGHEIWKRRNASDVE